MQTLPHFHNSRLDEKLHFDIQSLNQNTDNFLEKMDNWLFSLWWLLIVRQVKTIPLSHFYRDSGKIATLLYKRIPTCIKCIKGNDGDTSMPIIMIVFNALTKATGSFGRVVRALNQTGSKPAGHPPPPQVPLCTFLSIDSID